MKPSLRPLALENRLNEKIRKSPRLPHRGLQHDRRPYAASWTLPLNQHLHRSADSLRSLLRCIPGSHGAAKSLQRRLVVKGRSSASWPAKRGCMRAERDRTAAGAAAAHACLALLLLLYSLISVARNMSTRVNRVELNGVCARLFIS